ncbi:MAG: transposase, partial [Chitinophagaceae bacterium]
YYPVVCRINKLPVYMENRKGNTPESYRQLAIIKQTFSRCDELGISIDRFRADVCCYEKSTLQYLQSHTPKVNYYIRAEMNTGLRIALEDETDWQPALLGYKQVEVCSIDYPAFGGKEEYRIVAYRAKVTGQLTLFQQDGYDYHAVITSDEESAPLEVITFYNQRGCEGEHHFKELDHDFGWEKLPFETMEMNTVYMYMTMVGLLLFNTYKQDYMEKLSFVAPQMRLKNFTFHFVNLVARWIKSGLQWVLNIYTLKDYSTLWKT